MTAKGQGKEFGVMKQKSMSSRRRLSKAACAALALLGAVTVLLLAFGSASAQSNNTVSTIVLNYATDLATDSGGNLIAVDAYHNKVWKVTPAGVISLLAGTGVAGSADGPAATAQFNAPDYVAVDSSDNIYVGEPSATKIRKITPSGVVSTIFATMPPISMGGIAVDNAGAVYFSDTSNGRIMKILPGGSAISIAGSPMGMSGYVNGPAAWSMFFVPAGLAVDGGGNVYVADSYNNVIRKITPAGIVSTLAGAPVSPVPGWADGPAPTAMFSHPRDVALDSSGNLYVADEGNNRIRRITPNGDVCTVAGLGVAGSAVDGNGTVAVLGLPPTIAVTGNIVYTVDTGNWTYGAHYRIRKIELGSPACDPPQADLWMKDTMSPDLPEDYGVEPNQTAPSLFISSDIWIRPAQDTIVAGGTNPGPITSPYYTNEHQHQDPVYVNSGTLNYVYVKVRNRGLTSSTGTEKLRIYWAFASTGLPWPGTGVWNELDCSATSPGINPCSLPVMAWGQDYVVQLPWVPPDPTATGASAHVCLVARIETQPTAPFGMTSPEGTTLWTNVADNNNIVWKNIAVLTEGGSRIGRVDGRVIVRNTLPRSEKLTLRFAVPERELKDNFLLHGDIFVDLGEVMMEKWRRSGQPPQGFEVVNGTTIKITDPARAMLGGLLFDAGEAQTIEVRMQLRPGDKSTAGARFNWDVIQLAPLTKSARPSVIGGERYVFTVPKTAGVKGVWTR